MPSALNALPTITGTALGASLATGIPAGQYKTPTAVVGYMVPMDSLNFYIEASDNASFLSLNATATGTQVSGNFVNTVQKGATFFVNIAAVLATTTLGINVQNQDPANTSVWTTIARVSLDGIQTGATGGTAFQVYPGLTTQASLTAGAAAGAVNAHLGHTWRVQTSVTATASGGGAGLTFQISSSKVV